MKTKSFTIGDTITLRRGADEMRGVVGGATSDSLALRVNVTEPPEWYRKTLQSRGIILGPHADWLMFLFKDHKGQWTDLQTLDHFDIE